MHENHNTERDYVLYPEVRKIIPAKQVEKDVDLLLSANVTPSEIRLRLKDLDTGVLDGRDLANRR